MKEIIIVLVVKCANSFYQNWFWFKRHIFVWVFCIDCTPINSTEITISISSIFYFDIIIIHSRYLAWIKIFSIPENISKSPTENILWGTRLDNFQMCFYVITASGCNYSKANQYLWSIRDRNKGRVSHKKTTNVQWWTV